MSRLKPVVAAVSVTIVFLAAIAVFYYFTAGPGRADKTGSADKTVHINKTDIPALLEKTVKNEARITELTEGPDAGKLNREFPGDVEKLNRESDEIFCSVFRFYFDKADIENACRALIDRRNLYRHRTWGVGQNCIDKCIDLAGEYYFARAEHEKACDFLEKAGGEYLAARYMTDKLNDRAKAAGYLERRIAEAAGNTKTLAYLYVLRSGVTDDYDDYLPWLKKIYELKPDGDNAWTDYKYFKDSGDAANALKAAGLFSDSERAGLAEELNFMQKNENAPKEAVSMYLRLKYRRDEYALKKNMEMAEKYKSSAICIGFLENITDYYAAKGYGPDYNLYMDRIREVKLKLMTAKDSGEYSGIVSGCFTDLNNIISVTAGDDAVIFESVNGSKIYSVNDGTWQYVKGPRPQVPSFYGSCVHHTYDTMGGGPATIPPCVPQMTYRTIDAVDKSGDADWMVVSVADGGAVCFEEYVCDIKNNICRKFPMIDMGPIAVSRGTLWLGSCYGAVAMDVKTGKAKRYVTLPALSGLKGAVQAGSDIYYISGIYGLFRIDTASGEVFSVDAYNNRYLKQKIFPFAIAAVGDEIYISASAVHGFTGRYLADAANGYLVRYDTKTQKITDSRTGVPYADTLMESGDWLVGYGADVQGYEGGDYSVYGGMFACDIKTGSIHAVTKKPVFLFTADNGQFKAISLDMYGDDYGMLETSLSIDAAGMSVKSTKISSYVKILPGETEGNTRTIHSREQNKDLVFTINSLKFNECSDIFNERDRKKSIRAAEWYDKYLKNVKVKYKTIEYDFPELPDKD